MKFQSGYHLFFHSHSNNSALLWLTVGSCDLLHEKNALFSSNLVREKSNWDSAMQIQNDVKCHAVPFWLDKYLRMHFPFFVYVKFSPLLMNNFKPKVYRIFIFNFFSFGSVLLSFSRKKLLTTENTIRFCALYKHVFVPYFHPYNPKRLPCSLLR